MIQGPSGYIRALFHPNTQQRPTTPEMLQRTLYSVTLAGTMLACGAAPGTGHESTASAPKPVTITEQPTEPQKPVQATDNGEGLFAIINTTKGVIKVKLEYQKVPMTVANFVALAEGKQHNTAKPDGTPYFNGIKFHRVIADFMIQGGDPTGTGSGGDSAFGGEFADEISATSQLYKTGYKKGVLAMANRGANTNTSQFFIMLADADLPPAYTIFGKVVNGLDVVDKIGAVEIIPQMGPNDGAPKTPVVMEKVSIIK